MTPTGQEELLIVQQVLFYSGLFVGSLVLMVLGFWGYRMHHKVKDERAKAKSLFNHGERKNGVGGSHGKY